MQRISTTSRYNLLLADMQKSMNTYNNLTAQLSSGSKLTSITDDPIAAVNVINTNRQLGQMEIFSTNVGMASAELSALDDLMSLATGYLSSAWNKAIQANTQTYGDTSLEAMKIEIDETIKTMVDLANTEYNDNYIFSGANTKTLAYKIDDDGNIIYQGTPHDNPDYERQTEVADGVFEVINTTGDKVFGYYKAEQELTADGEKIFLDTDGNRVIQKVANDGTVSYVNEADNSAYTGDEADLQANMVEDYSGVMGALKKLSNSIQKVLDGDVEGGYAEMNSTLDMFASSLDTITSEQTKFGGVANRLEMTESTIETNTESLTNYITEINGVDYATAVTQWMNAQYAYQASMQIASASMNMSLLNYIN